MTVPYEIEPTDPPAPVTAAPAPPPAPEGLPGQPATISDRFVARLIDASVLVGVLIVFGLLTAGLDRDSPIGSVLAVIVLVVIYGYEIFMIGRYGQTLGKRAMRLRVLHISGRPLGWGGAVVRFIVPGIANCFTCGIGGILFYLSPLFDSGPWKRGWHDQLASSVVVKQP
jgi:uncharacterized RDD family membrane protein YckC